MQDPACQNRSQKPYNTVRAGTVSAVIESEYKFALKLMIQHCNLCGCQTCEAVSPFVEFDI